MDNLTPPPTLNGDVPDQEGHCTNSQCTRDRGILEGLNNTLRAEKAALETENTELRAEIARLRARSSKHTQRTWPRMLRQYLLTGDPSWDEVCRQCNKEENMSVNVKWHHPDIKFVTPEEGDAAVPDLLGPVDNRQFNFNALPVEVQARIFRLWLYKEGNLIHAISRLDPFVPNEDFPEEAALRKRSGLKHTFFYGERNCSITHSGQPPNSLLRILLVCRRFYFIGIHCFYGLNTFAFSSLGEFLRFCQGIGPARVDRLQHLEITLTGNQYLTVPLDEKGRIPYSRRTFPLSFLPDCHRLRTLVIHVDESSSHYSRRRYETRAIKEFMDGKTAGQPNQRKLRALRCIQGIDFIYALRGLEWIRFYDLHKAIISGTATREPVADWSFVEDVTNTATMQKVASRRESSKLENLQPLFSNNDHQQEAWNPGRADWELVKSFYIDNGGIRSYDQLRQDGFPHDADILSRMSASSGPRQGHSSNSGSSSSSSSSSSGGPHHGRGGPAIRGRGDRGKAAAARRGQVARGNASRGRGGQGASGRGRGGCFANVNVNAARSNPTPSPSIPVDHDTSMSSGSSDSDSDSDDSQGMAMSAAGGSIADAIDLSDSDSDTETDSPHTGSAAGSILIELLSDSESDSEEDSLFVSQHNHNHHHHHRDPSRSRHGSSSTGDAATPMLIDDDADDGDHHHNHHHHQAPSTTASVPVRLHSLTPMGFMTPSLMDRGISVPANLPFLGPPSFASLLNIQPASAAGARYLPPNNAAALESAAAGVAASRRGSMSMSMSMSRSVSRSVSRAGSFASANGGGSGSGSRAGTASSCGRSLARLSVRSGSSGSSGSSGLFVSQRQRQRQSGGTSERDSVDLTNADEDDEHAEDDEHGTSGGSGSGHGDGELMTIEEEKGDENGNDREGQDSGYEGADDSDVEMVDSV